MQIVANLVLILGDIPMCRNIGILSADLAGLRKRSEILRELLTLNW